MISTVVAVCLAERPSDWYVVAPMHGRVVLLLLAIAAQPCGGLALADTYRTAGMVAVSPGGGVAAAGSGPQQPDVCIAPAGVLGPDIALLHVAAALHERATLDLLAVGSATMLGPRGGAEGSYPERMVAMLRAAFPNATIRLAVRGGRGLTASEMLETLRSELSQRAYQLVLWQTATVEAIRKVPPGDLARTLSEGAERVRLAGANLVLIDPQYSRFLRANANLDPYLQAVQQTGALADVALFRRYDLMKHWVDAGQIDLEGASKPERQAVADVLHGCLARALAQFIVRGVAAAPP